MRQLSERPLAPPATAPWFLLAALGLLLGLGLAPPADAAETRDPAGFFDETFGDLSEELERARESGKDGIVVFFEQADCPFCARMRRTVLNRAEIQDWFRRHFLIFAVDIDGDTDMHDFQGQAIKAKDFAFRRNRVRATPVLAFYDLEGRRVARYTGALRDAREMRWLGEYVVGRHYLRLSFTRYKRERLRALSAARAAGG